MEPGGVIETLANHLQPASVPYSVTAIMLQKGSYISVSIAAAPDPDK